MDFSEFRNSAIERWQQGNPSELADLVRANKCNKMEREFVARILSGDAPRRKIGRKAKSRRPIKAGLIRFWLRDVDGVSKKDAIYREIEQALGVSTTAVRKHLEYIDKRETPDATATFYLFERELAFRKIALIHLDENEIASLRSLDFAPITGK